MNSRDETEERSRTSLAQTGASWRHHNAVLRVELEAIIERATLVWDGNQTYWRIDPRTFDMLRAVVAKIAK